MNNKKRWRMPSLFAVFTDPCHGSHPYAKQLFPRDFVMRYGFSTIVFLHGKAMRFSVIFRNKIICVFRQESSHDFQENRQFTVGNKIYHFHDLGF